MKQQRKANRVALIGIYHESNTFIETTTTMDDFMNGHILKGDQIVNEYQNAFHEIGGIIEYCDNNDMELIPVFYAEATPGGTIDRATYEKLKDHMLSALKSNLPVDGCLVVPHGAGVAEGYDDMDGDWLSAIRDTLGAIPIVGTLDPHANVSKLMISATDTLIAYSTNPHIDQRDTGRLAAKRLKEILDTGIVPVHIFKQTGIAISIEKQLTAEWPCLEVYKKAESIRQWDGIFSVSIILGFPYADVAEMGTSIIISGESIKTAEEAATVLSRMIFANKENFNGPKTSVAEAISAIASNGRPTLLLDMGDNVGGGAPGNSTVLLQYIELHTSFRCFICIYDPGAVQQVLYANRDIVKIYFGACHDGFGQSRFTGIVKIVYTGDGVFSEKEPRHGGQVNFDMGRIAVVVTEKGNTIMLTSKRVPPFSLRQITLFGIRPSEYDAIIAKGVNAPITAYKNVCPTYIQVDTPGYTQADMTRFTFRKRSKPLYPFE